jgi:hypothetical protein
MLLSPPGAANYRSRGYPMSAVLKEVVASSAVSANSLSPRDVPDDAASRYNIYTIIHKALRAFMADTLLKVGRMDVNDDAERGEAIAQVRALLAMCTGHLHHENNFVHPAIEKAFPRATVRTVDDHKHHEIAIAELGDQVARFESAPTGKRSQGAWALYLILSGFLAENFTHMIVEETENHAALIAAYTDAEILGIEQALVASLSPEQKFAAMQWMIPHINASERALLLGGMKRHAPPPVFEAVLGLARDSLSQRDFYKLERALG